MQIIKLIQFSWSWNELTFVLVNHYIVLYCYCLKVLFDNWTNMFLTRYMRAAALNSYQGVKVRILRFILASDRSQASQSKNSFINFDFGKWRIAGRLNSRVSQSKNSYIIFFAKLWRISGRLSPRRRGARDRWDFSGSHWGSRCFPRPSRSQGFLFKNFLQFQISRMF